MGKDSLHISLLSVTDTQIQSEVDKPIKRSKATEDAILSLGRANACPLCQSRGVMKVL